MVFGLVPAPAAATPAPAAPAPATPPLELDTRPRTLPAEAYLSRKQSPTFPFSYRELLLLGVVLPAPLHDGRAMVRGTAPPRVLELMPALPAPWLEVRPSATDDSSFTAERMVGVPASAAARELARQKRFFPLEVWLRLADVMLGALDAIPSEVAAPFRLHPLWTSWCGPHSLCATIDRRLVMTAGPMGLPMMPSMVGAVSLITDSWAMRGGRTDPIGARRALRWLLDPLLPLTGIDLETRAPRHPHVTRELFHALGQTPSVPAMRAALKALWAQTPPVSEAEAATFVLTCCPDLLAAETQAASASRFVPGPWKTGALQVMADQLLDAGPAVASVAKEPPELAPVTELHTRVMIDGLCVFEGRAPAATTLRAIAFEPLNPVADGERVTVVLEHGGKRDGVRLTGTVAQGTVVFDALTELQRVQLANLLAVPAPVVRVRASGPPPQ
jgi:hypothetical protein